MVQNRDLSALGYETNKTERILKNCYYYYQEIRQFLLNKLGLFCLVGSSYFQHPRFLWS